MGNFGSRVNDRLERQLERNLEGLTLDAIGEVRNALEADWMRTGYWYDRPRITNRWTPGAGPLQGGWGTYNPPPQNYRKWAGARPDPRRIAAQRLEQDTIYYSYPYGRKAGGRVVMPKTIDTQGIIRPEETSVQRFDQKRWRGPPENLYAARPGYMRDLDELSVAASTPISGNYKSSSNWIDEL